uniref:Xylanase inhibitor C-terminal domain-containing protein n=1 Tax=Triticum urartu TaxID=4572 RepID=A0A8R7UQN8_TRIUA
MLCLPGDGDRAGAAIFGGGPFFLARRADRPAVTTLLSEGVPLCRPFAGDPGYYVSASNGIAMDGARVAFASAGALIVGFSTTVRYTELRHDVYRPLIAAFDRAMGRSARRVRPAVAPFELCYDSTKLLSSQTGYSVPEVDVMLEGGQN